MFYQYDFLILLIFTTLRKGHNVYFIHSIHSSGLIFYNVQNHNLVIVKYFNVHCKPEVKHEETVIRGERSIKFNQDVS